VNTNTTVDFATYAKIEGLLFKGKTTLSGSFRRVGPNYYSFGLPFLVRDVMTFEVKYGQKLWKNRISFSAYLRRNSDNLENTKTTTTATYNFGFDFSLTLPKAPYVRANLTPIILQNDSGKFNMLVLNVTSGHSYKFLGMQQTSMLSFIRQSSTSDDSTLNFTVYYLTLNHTLNLRQGPAIMANASYIHSETPAIKKNTWIIGAGTSFTLFKKWNNTLGGNLYVNERELKWGCYYQSSVSLTRFFTINLRLENNQYNTYINLPGLADYTQFICRTSIAAKW
jgi:hypothetical protein